MALFAWFLVLVSVAVAGDRRSGSYAIDNGPEVSWAIDPSKFEVTLVSKRPVSWMSFGVSPTNGTMKGSDAFIAVGRAIYRVQLGPSGAEAGAFQTIAESYADGSIVQNGSNTIFNVRRPLDTDQPWQVAISQNQPVSLIVAWRDEPSPMGQLGIHSGHHSKLINNDTGALDREEAKVSRSDWYKQLRLPNTGLLVSYNIQGNKISFDIEANSETWIGIGWSERPSMHPSLAVIGQSPNQVEAFLINSDDVGAPDADLTSELSDTNFQSGNGKSRLQFTRPLQWSKSGTSRSFNIQVNGESTVIAATGSSTTMARHTETDIAQVSWSSGSTSSKGSAARAIAITHAVVMILAWLVLMPIAGIVARYFKDGEFRWILAHKALAICAVALTIVSFVLILWTHGRLFDSTHGLLGFFVVVLAVIQPVLAWFRNKARAIWRIQHRATAVILYLGALINCFLGAKLMYTTGTIFIALIVILLLIGLASIGFLEIKRGRASHQVTMTPSDDDRTNPQMTG